MFKGEVRSAWTTRTARSLWIGALVVVAVGAFSTTSSMPAQDLTGPVRDQSYFLLASVNLSLFALLVGIRSFTDEFRHGTITWKVLVRTERWKMVASKALVAALVAGVMAATAQLLAAAVAMPMASAKNGTLIFGGGDLAAGAGLTLAVALWGVIGVGLGALIRHQVAAVVVALVWVLAIENLGSALLRGGAKFLPGQAAHGLAAAGAAGDVLPSFPAGGVLLLYGVIATGAAIVTLSRRPITLSA